MGFGLDKDEKLLFETNFYLWIFLLVYPLLVRYLTFFRIRFTAHILDF